MNRSFSRRMTPRVIEGMEVLGADSGRVGFVRDILETEFLLYSPALGPILVPYSAIDWVSAAQVRLQVQEGKIAQMGWSVLRAVPMPASSLPL